MRKLAIFITALFATLSALATPPQDLTLEQKAARMIIVGMGGRQLTANNTVVGDIRDRGVSGVILFEKNVSERENLRKFIDDLKALSSTQLFVSIDQEGGMVNRLKPKYGFKATPTHKSVGQRNDPEYTRESANTIASEVASVGINVNFAPCVDVDINPECPVIGHFERSFSADAQEVTKHAKIYIEEHHKQRVLTSIKHFPGHGNSLVDSHHGFTDITATWQECELEPYRELINAGLCDMVMVSHLFNSRFDKHYPATLSHTTIDSLLRGSLGWQGVVISDDMQMGAIVQEYGFEQSITLGINAGVDLFIIGNNITNQQTTSSKFINTVVKGVQTGKISIKQIDKAIERIERLRRKIYWSHEIDNWTSPTRFTLDN